MPLSRREVLGAGAGMAAALAVSSTTDTMAAVPVRRVRAPDQAPGLPPLRHPDSLPALMRRTFASTAPDRRKQLAATDRWRKYLVMYPSADLHISGVLYVPRGTGPFPAVVLAHGYSVPAQYVSGLGMEREQRYLADRGFVVLQTDYRGHGASSSTDELQLELRLGFAEDTLNAAQALKQMPEVDPGKVALFGLSLGGGVATNALVAGPGIVRAGVTWAAVSSSFVDNYRSLLARRLPGRVEAIRRRYGPPTEASTFYPDLSSRTFFDRISEPVLLDHGTADPICPVGWSRATAAHMEQAGVDVRLRLRRGEPHIYSRRWQAAMDDTYAFLRERLES
ncbi:Prolyl oligopeptidase family protein [Raineyella antarctica]|uniref:Prolyl oligopeptidase family protein n=2 Tax=Raineyella antarctica TaxID=1577474 RepID=A0A1G6HH67_9ACTN|nr:Prolyl oligopeptidase family protein [Raineyella antarctica]